MSIYLFTGDHLPPPPPGFRLALCLAVLAWLALWFMSGCAPSTSPEYPRHDCRSGGSFTYHSDGAWDVTVQGDCGKAWD